MVKIYIEDTDQENVKHLVVELTEEEDKLLGKEIERTAGTISNEVLKGTRFER